MRPSTPTAGSRGWRRGRPGLSRARQQGLVAVGEAHGDRLAELLLHDALQLRAERDGKRDGRVYTVRFTATDEHSGTCQGEVRAGIVTHDQGSDLGALDSGPPWYDSMTGDRID